jgi:hypothetical protein
VGDARVFLPENTGDVRRFQTSHRLLSHGARSESLHKGAFEICHVEGVGAVSTGEAATATLDPQDHRVPSTREYRERREVEDVTRNYTRNHALPGSESDRKTRGKPTRQAN